MSKQTGWVIAATEGATVDGRTITKAWIDDMAELYSVDEYTALIWPEHFRSSWSPFEGKNWGVIDEVKAAKSGGKLRLFVKLTANHYLLDANKDSQKLFMSIEPDMDYKGTGRCYLRGLAVTDSPASSGTTRLKFSVGNSAIEHEYSQLEPLELIDFIQGETELQKEKSFYNLIAGFFKNQLPNQVPQISEEEPMNKEQFDALMGKFETFGSKLNELETKVDTFGDKPVTAPVVVEEDPVEPVVKTQITPEQFSTLNETLTGLTGKFEAMETKFNALKKEAPNQEPNPEGLGTDFSLV